MSTLARRYDIPEMASFQERRLLEAEDNLQEWYRLSYIPLKEVPLVAGIYSIAAAIVAALVIGIVLSSNNTAPIINAAGSTFVNSLKAAKP